MSVTMNPTGTTRSVAVGAVDPAEQLRRAAQGDQQAFAAFYDATCRQVYRLALLLARDPADADDLCREAYVRAWREAADHAATGLPPIAWLLGLVREARADLDDEAA
ncbi:RNA polymerase sigma-70 factor (ECF subfamily) [Nocardioides sp. J9]|nr:RNA polymerase sigma-70 factor (ECF subfamily) [Nocardioides sp. J9]